MIGQSLQSQNENVRLTYIWFFVKSLC